MTSQDSLDIREVIFVNERCRVDYFASTSPSPTSAVPFSVAIVTGFHCTHRLVGSAVCTSNRVCPVGGGMSHSTMPFFANADDLVAGLDFELEVLEAHGNPGPIKAMKRLVADPDAVPHDLLHVS